MAKNVLTQGQGHISNVQYSSSYGSITNNSTASNTFGHGYGYVGSWTNPLEILEDKSINLEKLDEMSSERRKSILSIISYLAVSTDSNVRKLLLNTLESYNILEDRDVVSRKAKIESVVK